MGLDPELELALHHLKLHFWSLFQLESAYGIRTGLP